MTSKPSDSRISIHALREEGDACGAGATLLAFLFQSTPSARRATLWSWRHAACLFISIHALREEGDSSLTIRRAMTFLFQSTPSARRATEISYYGMIAAFISIHALREEGDADHLMCAAIFMISIHALREEGDRFCVVQCNHSKDFNPRPPRGGRPSILPADSITSLFQSTPSARRATCKDTF